MNLIGKIFVVLILVMSLVFMSFAVAVYGTHRNWKAEAEDQAKKVAIARDELAKAETQRDELQAKLKQEQEARVQALGKLEEQRKELQTQRDELVKERDNLLVKDKEAVAALNSAQQNLARLTKEVEGLRTEIRDAQGERDKHFDRVVELTDQIHQAQGEVKRLQERRVQLASQLASANLVLDRHGLHKDLPVDGIPPQLFGKVLAVNRDDMVELSLGTDDGLRVGHTLEVFRGSKYLGRVEVLHATTDRAVAKIVPGFKKGIIQRDDDVTTRFKVG
jgi:septal ring factor EnvC (AmiA/AmiB activator)